MDRLIEAIEDKQNPSVVGLDPTDKLVPAPVMDAYAVEAEEQVESDDNLAATAAAAAYFEFNRAIIDAVYDIVPAVKPQIAMYEALGPAGIDCYTMTCEYAQSRGLYVIGDVKRGDIGSTAAAYAHHLTGFQGDDVWFEDAVTVNPYLGSDGIEPFMEAAGQADRDMFILVRTRIRRARRFRSSNWPMAAGCMSMWPIWWRIGARIPSAVSAIPGPEPWSVRRIPRRVPHCASACPTRSSSCPGTGAQGGTAQSVAGMFDHNGSGAIVNSSRGIIGAWRNDEQYSDSLEPESALELVAVNARAAAADMRDQLRVALA